MTPAPSDPPNPYGPPDPYGPPSLPTPPNQARPSPGHPQPGPPQPGPPQPGPPQPGPPQPGPLPAHWGAPPAAGGSAGTVVLTIQGNQFTSSLLVPSVRVNGRQIVTQYGRQDIPVPAGPVHVEAEAQWMRTYGQASLDFTVQPGQWVPVFYAAPYHQFTTGSMGHVQQQRKGFGALLGIIGGSILLVVAVFVGVIVAAVLATT